MTTCDHASDDDFCIAMDIDGVVYHPPGTDLTLCRRHNNLWRRENGLQVAKTVRKRYPDGDAVPGHDPVLESDAPNSEEYR